MVAYLVQKIFRMGMFTTVSNLEKTKQLFKATYIPQFFVEYNALMEKDSLCSYVIDRI